MTTEPLDDPGQDSDIRSGEQRVAAGKADQTPVVVLSTVVVVIGALVLVALGLVALAYWLA